MIYAPAFWEMWVDNLFFHPGAGKMLWRIKYTLWLLLVMAWLGQHPLDACYQDRPPKSVVLLLIFLIQNAY